MITCATCGERYLQGTLFCVECGAYLLDTQPAPPAQLAMEDGGWGTGGDPSSAPSPSLSVQTVGEALPAWLRAMPEPPRPAKTDVQVRLFILSSRRMVTLPSMREVRIGRADARRNVHPELDLTEDGGLDAGVSRLHAAIQRQNGEVAIIDLGSSNGTRVNGVDLLPNRPQPLNDGDEVELGALQLRIYLDRA